MSATRSQRSRSQSRRQQRRLRWESLEARQMMSATPASEYHAVILAGHEWHLSPGATQTGAVETRGFGLAGDQFLAGDWNGDRLQDTIVVRPNADGGLTWIVDLNGDDQPDVQHKYGLAGDTAVIGDWNGDGKDDPGVARRHTASGTWHWQLDTSRVQYANPAARSYGLLSRGDRPIVGDWNGDGKDDVGVTYEDSARGYLVWKLDTNGDRYEDVTRDYGLAGVGDVPLAGDWNGDRKDDLAVAHPDRSSGEWVWLYDTNGDQFADRTSRFGRLAGRPIVVEHTLTPSGRDGDDRLSEARSLGMLYGTRSIGESISVKTDVDLFRFTVTAGQQVTFDIDTATNGPPGMGSFLRLFDAEGRPLSANQDRLGPNEQTGPNGDRDGFDSYIDYRFGTGGTYYVGVSNWQHENYDPVTGRDALGSDPRWLTGSYTLVISTAAVQPPAGPPPAAQPVATFDGRRLVVRGTNNADNLTVIEVGGRISVEHRINGTVRDLLIDFRGIRTPSLSASQVQRVCIFGEAGADKLENLTSKPSDMIGGAGQDTMYGGRSVDLMWGGGQNEFVFGEAVKDILYGGAGNDILWGGGGDDDLYGGEDDDVLYGGTGNDTLTGFNGADHLYGGAGSDRLYGGSGLDGLFGGEDFDWLTGGSDGDRFLVQPNGDAVLDRSAVDAVLTFADGDDAWAENEIHDVDITLRGLHQRTRNTRLLKFEQPTSSGTRIVDLVFVRCNSLLDDEGESALAQNYNDGTIHFADDAFGNRLELNETLLHEIGHNWDKENPNWRAFLTLSGWTQTNPNNSAYVRTVRYGETWWYFNDPRVVPFVSNYAKSHPEEDFAESFAAVLTGTASTIPAKAALINDWLNSLRS